MEPGSVEREGGVPTSGQHHEVPLQRESEVLAAYLHVQQVRHGDELALDCELDPACRAALVPHLLLQPLAENSLRHGLGAEGGPMRLVDLCQFFAEPNRPCRISR